MIKVTASGRLTKDIAAITTPSGVTYARFCLASHGVSKEGGNSKVVEFLNCIAWRQKAEILGAFGKQGDSIVLYGILQQNTFTKKDGTSVTSTELLVEDFDFLGSGKKESTEEKPAAKQQSFIPVDMDDDDLPF